MPFAHRSYFFLPALIAAALVSSAAVTAPFAPGQLVRLTRGEMLQFNGKDLAGAGAGKGEEFAVLKHDPAQKMVFVGYVNKNAELIAVSLPAESLEAVPPTPWIDLAGSAEAFRDGRYADLKPRLTRAAKDASLTPTATLLWTQMNGAITSASLVQSTDSSRQPAVAQALGRSLANLRETAANLVKQGIPSLALAVDQGTDRLAAQYPAAAAPATKLDRDALGKSIATAQFEITRARHAIALARGVEATEHLEAALKCEPARPDFKTLLEKVQKDYAEAGDRCNDADKMRRFPKGAVHALTAIEMGLKLCADHPRLRALRKEMEAQFEERTAPPVTSEFLAAAGNKGSAEELQAGYKLYTARCTECHDAELLDSRSIGGWRTIVGSMAGRARISEAEQARIVTYLAAAQSSLKDEN